MSPKSIWNYDPNFSRNLSKELDSITVPWIISSLLNARQFSSAAQHLNERRKFLDNLLVQIIIDTNRICYDLTKSSWWIKDVHNYIDLIVSNLTSIKNSLTLISWELHEIHIRAKVPLLQIEKAQLELKESMPEVNEIENLISEMVNEILFIGSQMEWIHGKLKITDSTNCSNVLLDDNSSNNISKIISPKSATTTLENDLIALDVKIKLLEILVNKWASKFWNIKSIINNASIFFDLAYSSIFQVSSLSSKTSFEINSICREIDLVVSWFSNSVNKLCKSDEQLDKVLQILELLTKHAHESWIETPESKFFDIVNSTSNEICKIFNDWLAKWEISETDLFPQNFVWIDWTNPRQYNTKLADFTDNKLRKLLEKVKSSNSRIAYVVPILNIEWQDPHTWDILFWYIPTHNDSVSIPPILYPTLQAQIDRNIATSRNRKFYNDRVGKISSQNPKDETLLQIYLRDIWMEWWSPIYDFSCPINVKIGSKRRHWWSVRIWVTMKK